MREVVEADRLESGFSELYGGTQYSVEGVGPTVLLIHGLGQDSMLWDRVSVGLKRDCRVIRFDLLGHGKSAKPPGPYTLVSYLRQFEIIDRRVGLNDLHLVGHSAGAFVALRYALSAPERVRSVTLLHPFARLPQFATIRRSSAEVASMVEEMGERCDPAIIKSSEEIFKDFWRELSDQDLSMAAGVQIIVGANDPTYQGPTGHDLNQKIQGSSIYCLPKIGVLSPLDDAVAIEELIRDHALAHE